MRYEVKGSKDYPFEIIQANGDEVFFKAEDTLEIVLKDPEEPSKKGRCFGMQKGAIIPIDLSTILSIGVFNRDENDPDSLKRRYGGFVVVATQEDLQSIVL